MFSRLAGAALGLLILGFAGCGSKNPPGVMGLSLGGRDAGCLARASKTFSRYLEGLASDSETGSAFDCAIHSLTLFRDRTRGQKAGTYAPTELRAFLERYFLDGLKVGDSFLQEAMFLKEVLAGGGPGELSRLEINAIIDVLGLLKEQAIQVRPFMPLSLEAAIKRDDAQLDAAGLALKNAARIVGERLQKIGTTYTLAHFDGFIVALRDFQGDDASPLLTTVHDRMELIKAAKASFLVSAPDQVGGLDWVATLSRAADWYSLALKAYALQNQESWVSGYGRERMVSLAREAFDLVGDALARHPQQTMSFAEIDRLVDLAFPKGLNLLKDRMITPVHLKTFLRPLILRWMGGADVSRTGRKAAGLTLAAWQRTRQRLEHWNGGQRYLEAVFQQAAHDYWSASSPPEYTLAQFAPLTLEYFQTKGGLAADGASDVLSDAVARLRRVISEERSLFRGDAHQIFFDGYPTERALSFHNLSEANWMHELARILTAGYAEDRSRAATGDDLSQAVTFEEFKRFVTDINDIGIDVKYVDPTDPHLAQKRFREGELFTFAGTGSEYLNTRQAAQLLALMLSGKRLADMIHHEAIDSGCKTLGWDPFEYQLVDPVCYRRHFFGNIDHFWANLPKLAAFYHTLDSSRRELFERSMEDGARKGGYGDTPINSTDSEGFGMIGQYIEVVFSRFDADDSGTIDWNEAQQAFPVFQRALHEMSCGQGHCLNSYKDLNAAFTYLLAHGHSPSALAFLRWRYFPFFRSVNADRGTLMQIFAALGKPTPGQDSE